MLVALAGQQDRVARLCQADGMGDRGSSVVDDPQVFVVLGAGSTGAVRDLSVDLLGVFATGILVGHDHEIRQLRGDTAHLRPFQEVPLTRRAEQYDQPPRSDRAEDAQHLLDGIRRVGVVDDHAERLAEIDSFHAPSHAVGGCQRFGCKIWVDLPSNGERERRQRVLDVERPGERDVEGSSPTRRGDRQVRAIGSDAEFGCAHIGLFVHAVAQHPVTRVLAQDRPAGVVAVQDGEGGLVNKERLGVAVGLECAVELEVLVRQVGEHRGTVSAVAHAPECEAVRRGLDHRGLVAHRHHPRQQLLELERLGGRCASEILLELIAHLDVHSPEQSGSLACRGQDLGTERSDGRLAIGAGDADRRQVSARLGKPQVGGVRQGVSGVGDHQLWSSRGGQLLLHDHRPGARIDGVGHVEVSIGVLAGHREEERSRLDLARVVGERGDLAQRHANHPLRTDAIRQRTQAHAPPGRPDGWCLAGHCPPRTLSAARNRRPRSPRSSPISCDRSRAAAPRNTAPPRTESTSRTTSLPRA